MSCVPLAKKFSYTRGGGQECGTPAPKATISAGVVCDERRGIALL